MYQDIIKLLLGQQGQPNREPPMPQQLPEQAPIPTPRPDQSAGMPMDEDVMSAIMASMQMPNEPEAPDNPNPVPGTYDDLKLEELLMEPTEQHRPRVKLEEDKEEWDYPHTRKYNYVEPNMTPEENAKEYLNELLRESRPRHYDRERSIRKRNKGSA